MVSVLHFVARVFIAGLIVLGPVGGARLVELLHAASCACASCGEREADGCCSGRGSEREGPSWSGAEGGCACTVLPEESAPVAACVLPASISRSRSPACGAGDLDDGAGPAPVWTPFGGRGLWPGGAAQERCGPQLASALRLVGCSGGERAALLGCARL